MRRYLATLLLFLGSALPAAENAAPSDEALMLSACRGRYTALLEHAWLMQDNIEAVRMRRDLFAAMQTALLRDAPEQFRMERALLSFRIAQKRVAANLLNTARFHTDQRRARYALGQITQQLKQCDRLVIGLAPLGA
ncbi:hypothetical protein [Antarctobacter jejuensis]|uniref:hypothetical protein n=1 Tax=Antarctobacter jejuensis TaxID=1439938 RepID=UPI003FD5229C